MKKPVSMVRERIAHAVLDSVSKAALIDLVVDLIRQNAGDENLDGVALGHAFVEAFTPVATARGERVPSVTRIVDRIAKSEAAHRAAEIDYRAKYGASPCAREGQEGK